MDAVSRVAFGSGPNQAVSLGQVAEQSRCASFGLVVGDQHRRPNWRRRTGTSSQDCLPDGEPRVVVVKEPVVRQRESERPSYLALALWLRAPELAPNAETRQAIERNQTGAGQRPKLPFTMHGVYLQERKDCVG